MLSHDASCAASRHRHTWIPHAVLVLWIAFLGVATWQKVRLAQQPPAWDVLTYFSKAQAFWSNIHSGSFKNPLDLEPTIRAPGTVLMSYPFGFTEDFHGFYFRSVLFGLLGAVLAVYLAAWGESRKAPSNFDLLGVALLLSSLPAFYNSLNWGYADNFFAGVAACSAAACVRSARTFSRGWATTAFALAALCLLIKPVGLAVMGLIALAWLLLTACHRVAQPEEPTRLRRFLFSGTLVMALVYVSTTLICWRSQYLSANNLAYGSGTFKFLPELEPPITASYLRQLIVDTFGFFFVTALLLTAVAMLWDRHKWQAAAGKSGLVATVSLCLACISVGFLLWTSGSGVSQIRYLFPFAIMGSIFLIPLWVATIGDLPRIWKSLFRMLFYLPAINLALLLLYSNPSAAWQKWSGINLSLSPPEVQQARLLLREARAKGRTLLVFGFYTDVYAQTTFGALTSVGSYEQQIHPSQPTVVMELPVNWVSPSVYRTDDILKSDFLAFNPIGDAEHRTAVLSNSSPKTFQQESQLFRAIFSQLNEAQGVALVSDGPLRILRIVDRKRLGTTLAEWLNQYAMRRTFVEANYEHWWTEQKLQLFEHKNSPAIRDIAFDNLFLVRQIMLSRNGDNIGIGIWWQCAAPVPDRWFFFIHSVDRAGRTSPSQEIPLSPWCEAGEHDRIRFDKLTFANHLGDNLDKLGVGIYKPGIVLKADKGNRDWDGRRILLDPPVQSRVEKERF